MNSLVKNLKNAKKEELLQIYLEIEPDVLPLLEKKSKNQALKDMKEGRVFTAKDGHDLVKQCLSS